MSKGGFRPNAGRPPKNRTPRCEIAQSVLELAGIDIKGMSAMEVMYLCMGHLYESKDYKGAASIAGQLLPYEAPRLANIAITTTSEPAKMTDAELAALLAAAKEPEETDEAVTIN